MTLIIIFLILGAVVFLLFVITVLLSIFSAVFGDGGKEERQLLHDMQETDYMLEELHKHGRNIDARQVHLHNHY